MIIVCEKCGNAYDDINYSNGCPWCKREIISCPCGYKYYGIAWLPREYSECPRCSGQHIVPEKPQTTNSPVQQKIKEIGTGVVDLLLKKNTDYGSSVFESPILFPELKAKDCILIRMSDKIKRFSNLVSGSKTPEVDESIADTMKDLAGYAILWLVANSMETNDAVSRD